MKPIPLVERPKPNIGKTAWLIYHTIARKGKPQKLVIDSAVVVNENGNNLFLDREIRLSKTYFKRENHLRFSKEEAKLKYIQILIEKEKKLNEQLKEIYRMQEEVWKC